MKKIGTSALALGLTAPFVLAGPPVPKSGGVGAGRLMVYPQRVILDDAAPRAKGTRGQAVQNRGRSAEILLINGGKERSTYRISVMNMEMKPDGGIREVPKAPGQITAEDLIRFSPRQVVLEPGITQTVRVQVRMREDLPAGEYRTHMTFKAVPTVEQPPAPDAKAQAPAEELPTDQAAPVAPRTFSMNLNVIYGLSIPIIIRHGATHVATTLSDLRLEPSATKEGPARLHFHLNRTGNKSAYGDLEAVWTPKVGLPRKVGLLKGVAIYANLAQLAGNLNLEGLTGPIPGPGTLKLRYLEPETGRVMAEAVLDIPQGPPG